MMPAHYALSDAAIVVAAAWGIRALSRGGWPLAAFAMACFGSAAAVGVLRFGAGLQDALAPLHAGASQLLGLAGAVALALTFVRAKPALADIPIAAGLLVAATAVFILTPAMAPLFLIVAMAVALVAALWRSARGQLSWLAPSGLGLMVAAMLFVRRAPWLSEAASWHGFHLLLAVALAMVAAAMRNGAEDLPFERK